MLKVGDRIRVSQSAKQSDFPEELLGQEGTVVGVTTEGPEAGMIVANIDGSDENPFWFHISELEAL